MLGLDEGNLISIVLKPLSSTTKTYERFAFCHFSSYPCEIDALGFEAKTIAIV